jgi:hypothetical protein
VGGTANLAVTGGNLPSVVASKDSERFETVAPIAAGW